jgi:peptidoglycan lytic transglycosylase D
MVRRFGRAWLAVVPFVAAACGAGARSAPVTTPAQPLVAAPPLVTATTPLVVADPVVDLIAASEHHFEAGQSELAQGHVEAARREFDKALAVLMDSSYGGRTEPRIREHFDRMVDRISAYEIRALAEGDGFTEKQYEPASIDELLAMSASAIPTAPDEATANSVRADSVEHDVPIPLNQRVLAFIELFQGRLHDFLEEGMRRGTSYLPMIQSVFRAEGLPLDLAYIPLVESAFKPNALSRAKAKGVWQFMRGTGAENGLRQDWYIDERSDPEKATVAAAKYLSTLAKMFDGDWHLALASYNGGPGRVQRAMKRGRLDNFWGLAAKPNLLPRETRDYVPMILAAIVIARNPLQYGFDFEAVEPVPYDTVMLPRPVDLRRVAEWTETPVDAIQALNPELRRWTTPVRDTDYELKVPHGTADIVQLRLAESATGDLAALKWYTARPGETLTSIARKLRVSRTDLAEANYLKVSSRIAAGQQLMVPHEATVLMAARAERSVPVAESRRLAADAVVDAPSADRVKVVYEVKQGDTLSSIASLFRTTVAALRTWNRLPSTRIEAGDQLTIYTARAN